MIMTIITRYNRMRGKATLWVPGSDHAGRDTRYTPLDEVNQAIKGWFFKFVNFVFAYLFVTCNYFVDFSS